MLKRLKNFLGESKEEFTKVNWPSSQETIRYTIFVIILSLIVAAFLGVLDFVFVKELLQKIIL